MLPLKKIYRSQCSLFCNTTSKVDSFVKFHAGGNLGEQDISTYRSTVTAVIGMCKDFEFELGQFIKKWSSGKEDGEPSNQHGAARSEKRKREGLSDRTDVHVEPKEFKEITQQQTNPHDADSSDFEEGNYRGGAGSAESWCLMLHRLWVMKPTSVSLSAFLVIFPYQRF